MIDNAKPKRISRRTVGQIAVALLSVAPTSTALANDTKILSSDDVVMVSRQSFDSKEPSDIVQSNIDIVNALRDKFVRPEEISHDALISYYVDYYLAQVNNGGFAQFVFNSRWSPDVIKYVRTGLTGMNAHSHAKLFEEGANRVNLLGQTRLKLFFESQYFGDNTERDTLNSLNDQLYKLAKTEDLTKLNAAWLRSRPGLLVLAPDRLDAEIGKRAEAIPDLAARKAKAKENAPRYAKLIDALCNKAGLRLDQITAGSFMFRFDGVTLRELTGEEVDQQPVTSDLQIAWYFQTDKGLYLMVEGGGKAAIFDDATKTKAAEIDAPAP